MKKILIVGGHPSYNAILDEAISINKNNIEVQNFLFTSEVLDFTKSKPFDLLLANENLIDGDNLYFLLENLSKEQIQKTIVICDLKKTSRKSKERGVRHFISRGNVKCSEIIDYINSEIDQVL